MKRAKELMGQYQVDQHTHCMNPRGKRQSERGREFT